MGNVNTTTNMYQDEQRTSDDLWWNPVANNTTNVELMPNLTDSDNSERIERRKVLNRDLDEFKRDLHLKHEEKRQLIVQKKQELINLRAELKLQKMINEDLQTKLNVSNETCAEDDRYDNMEILIKENEEQKRIIQELKERTSNYEEVNEKNKELRINLAKLQDELQSVNAEVIDFESERNEYKTHVNALKDVIKVTKEMLHIRENQIQELKQKISIIEVTLADREMSLQAENLRKEYERQLKNIRSLRTLYEERERVDRREKQNMLGIIEETKKLLQNEQNKNQENQTRIEELEKENSAKYDAIKNLESQLGLSHAECKQLQSEMGVINQLFSQILLGCNNSQDMDLEKLIKILEENHDLLSKIAIDEESTEISTVLPKTLLDLVNRMNQQEQPNEKEDNSPNKLETIVEETDGQIQIPQLTSAEEIVQNLPKVWKVLIELLSHQCAPFNTINESPNDGNEFCYKSVETPKGPKLVLSVSKTFIRLKDLILEKKSLEKETNHLKHLNTHLEIRLQDQEKRLQTVSNELNKTWHVVGKMQRQHQQLHTHEKILRYELAQKRKLLTELKEELEYCREKWLQARAKNSTTEEQWKQLRKEFASRKPLQIDVSSTESGYSDDKSSSDEEPVYENRNDFNVDAENVKEKDSIIDDGPMMDDKGTTTENGVTTETVHIKLGISSTNDDNNHSDDTTVKTDTVQSDERQIINDVPCTSKTSDQNRFNLEEMLAKREERLKRMEEQGKELVTKVTNTTKRSLDIYNKLENLHEIYGDNSTTRTGTLNENTDDTPQSSSSGITNDTEDVDED